MDPSLSVRHSSPTDQKDARRATTTTTTTTALTTVKKVLILILLLLRQLLISHMRFCSHQKTVVSYVKLSPRRFKVN